MEKARYVRLLTVDEILFSVRDKYMEEYDLLKFVKHRPEGMELVFTGRGASQSLIELADYVSSIEKIKHLCDTGISSRKGIEY